VSKKEKKAMSIKKLGVVGCGQMGAGIVQVCGLAGVDTIVREVSVEVLEKGLGSIRKALNKQVEKGKLEAEDADAAMNRIEGTVDLASLADCDLVVEAVTEDFDTKKQIFQELARVCKNETILASNTSSLSITQLMTTTDRPDRFLGLHFFNPVPVMKLVEVVKTFAVDTGVYEEVLGFAEGLGKTPVRCEDRTGFLVNRLLIPYLLDAIRAFESGTGSMEDIDQAMRLGCGHPMGPFQLLDFIGLDTVYQIASIMYDEFRERRMSPPPLLRRMVYAGRLGRKSGTGFYDYQR
jgi:3-hydroxybutyryl-CoA dehydrogenase